jgi:hypothetical protein
VWPGRRLLVSDAWKELDEGKFYTYSCSAVAFSMAFRISSLLQYDVQQVQQSFIKIFPRIVALTIKELNVRAIPRECHL